MTPEQRRQLASDASTGADLSPGDPVAKAAIDRINLLECALRKIRAEAKRSRSQFVCMSEGLIMKIIDEVVG